ncbi:hypothetical protein [Glacieibacterium sp.]|uniref:hypothetical protein n=1 Tax=Glacieibacterium sp. TaxID=2860237 RepID=UPI003AFF6324
MSDFFTLTPGQPPAAVAPTSDEYARGDDWVVKHRSGTYILEYWSGELADHLKTVTLSQQDADALRLGKTSVDQLLAAKGVL